MKIKEFLKDESVLIIDGFSKLLIVQMDEIAKEDYKGYRGLHGDYYVSDIKFFTTQKGREAIRLTLDGRAKETDSKIEYSYESYPVLHYEERSGDRNHGNFEKRKPSKALFLEKATTSNGGGCWTEVWILKEATESAERQEIFDEINNL